MRTSLFLVIAQRIAVISYRLFGTNYWCHLKTQELVAISYRGFATTLEVGTDMLSRNIGKKLPHHAM
jgi:hypothetical protein